MCVYICNVRAFALTLDICVLFQLLYEEWASYSVFYKYQPIGLIR